MAQLETQLQELQAARDEAGSLRNQVRTGVCTAACAIRCIRLVALHAALRREPHSSMRSKECVQGHVH